MASERTDNDVEEASADIRNVLVFAKWGSANVLEDLCASCKVQAEAHAVV